MAKSSRPNRQWWFRLHSWAGLKFSLLMFFVSLTGTLAVFAYEIDWLLTPELRVTPQPAASARPAGELLAAAHRANPEWTITSLNLELPSFMAAEAIARDPAGELQRIYLNPYTAEVIGVAPWFNAHRFLRQTHRHLMLPLKWGLSIVGLLSIPLLLSLASAFPIYKKWWRGFRKTPKGGDTPRRWWGDLHRLLGVWSLPFIALIAITGLWYLIERWGGAAAPASRLLPEYASTSQPRGAPTLTRAIDQALAQNPEFALKHILLSEGKPLLLQGQATALLVRNRANTIAVDAHSQRIVGQVKGEQLTAHQRIAEAADPLHFGTFAGYTSKIVWFIWGMAMTLLSASGVWLCALRLGSRRTGPAPTAAWRQIGRSRWLQLALILLSLGLSLPFIIA
ncbi:PepSY-associated TM helix domain-containing protein [Gilvimarinus algae]|uniref:PepSY-associated TM helix domain-containing protein n=1 Tax=Gilvimarinus algae TaxID=3058037 RepID=A0ABT8TB25_9GAMM|nr:PepSY-associated TM helix domain-containing protein [Gilvimarinus sp. SDUM040014]MDO3380784.1 PepSY-associated TM helix domain-containing protein [Gilvimarinus sp. SDUM040014]